MSKFWRELIFKLVTLVVGFGLTIALTYCFDDDAGRLRMLQALIGACLGLLIVEFIRVQTKLDEQDKRVDRMSAILAEKSLADARRAALLRTPMQQLHGIDEVSQAWIDLLWSMQAGYVATNHIPKKDIYEKGYAKCALGIQSVKHDVKSITITKVFIVNNDAELSEMRETMAAQRNLGFQIKYIRYETIEKGGTLKHDHLASIDFGIFDDETVLIWDLDTRTREPVGGRILTGEDTVKPYKAYFCRLLQEASDLNT